MRNGSGFLGKNNTTFTTVFLEEDLTKIIQTIEDMVLQARGSEKDYQARDFASNLYKLGLKCHNDDYIAQAEKIFQILPLLFQADGFRSVGEYCLQRTDLTMKENCFPYLFRAFEHWKEALKHRDPAMEMMSDYDFFRRDLSILKGLKKGGLKEELLEGKDLLLAQIQTFSPKFQPHMISQVVEVLIDIETPEQLKTYFTTAENVIDTFTEDIDEVLADDSFDPTSMMTGPLQTARGMAISNSVFDLQLALAKETKSIPTLTRLLKASEKRTIMPDFSVFSHIRIAQVFHEIEETSKAIELLKTICTKLLADYEIKVSKMPEMMFFTIMAAAKVVEFCIQLNQLDLARQLLPILQSKSKEISQMPVPMVDQRDLLIKLGEYTREDLLQEFTKVKAEVKTTPPRFSPDKIDPDDFFPHGPETRKPIFSIPQEYQKLAELAQLSQIGKKLEAHDVVEEIEEIMKTYRGKNGGPSIREKMLEQTMGGQPPLPFLPAQIIEAHKANDIKKTEELLHQFQAQISHNLTQLDKLQLPSHPGYPGMGDKNIRRFLMQAELAAVLLEINKPEKAHLIIDEIKEYYVQKNPLAGMSRGMQPGYPPLGLYRRYLTLKITAGYDENELEELIQFTENNDPTGMPFLGLLVLEKGDVAKAQEILDVIIKSKKKSSQKDQTMWESYYKRKNKILRRLGEKIKSDESLKHVVKEPREFGEFWSIEQERNLEKYLIRGEVDKISREINKILIRANLFFVNSSLRPLLTGVPPDEVDRLVWQNARQILEDKLVDILHSYDPESGVTIGIQRLIKVLVLLITLEKPEIVKAFALRLIATLQDAIEDLLPSEIINRLQFIPVSQPAIAYQPILAQVAREPHLLFFIEKNDFWQYFKTSVDDSKLRYDQFHNATKKWIKEVKSGNTTAFFQYIGISYVYSVLLDIFSRLGEQNLVSMCHKNAEVFRKLRLEKVQEEPSMYRMDPDWYLNLFNTIKTEIHYYMKHYRYDKAKELYDLSFTLLDHEGVKKEDLTRSITAMFSYLAEY